MEFIRRRADESPIAQRMLQDATNADELEKALDYMDKVDAFHKTGEVTVTQLEYEGPDLSPGAERENSMKGVSRRKTSPIYDSDGNRLDGRKASVLSPTEDYSS